MSGPRRLAWAALVCGLVPIAYGEMPKFDAGQCAVALKESPAGQGAERQFYQGACLAREGEWARAEERLATYAAARPGDTRGWYWLAQAQLYQKRFAQAKASIERAVELDTRSAEAYRTLGEIELELRNYDAAYKAWISANKLNPLDARTTYYIGRLFFEADFLNESAEWLRQTLKLAPAHYAAMTYLAMCSERLNLQKTAIDLYQDALRESRRQNKPYPWAFLSFAKLLRQLGNDDQAFALLEEAEKLCPEPHALTALGQMLSTRNQPERAEQVLRRAIAMDDSIPDAHYRLALLLHMTGRAAEAQVEMQRFQQAKVAEERNKPKIQAVRKNG
jgi:tetratricopeptide (TPR) repeat protein